MADPDQTALRRIAEALERLAPAKGRPPNWGSANAFVWNADIAGVEPVAHVASVGLGLLKGIDQVATTLLENTLRFATGLPANNALLWGARGMGKSSLVKAAHAEVAAKVSPPLILVEIHREDIAGLPRLMRLVRQTRDRRFLIFCDDLSFEAADTSYKSLKAALEGGIEGRPANAVFYATSNRRHLLPRDMLDNERSTAINPGDAVEERISLSDRFGLWLGFHACSQDDYLAMVAAYATHFGLAIAADALRREAIAWAATRGGRSGRVAFQFIQDIAGQLGKKLD